MPRNNQHVIAVYPGSFDPVTHGHLDVIRRAAAIFNELVVGVGTNPNKDELFPQAERVDLLAEHVAQFKNVRIEAYGGLTIHFAKACGASVLVRGIRDISDFSDEIQQASLNRAIGDVETVFLLTSEQHIITSSTYVKQIYELGGGEAALVERLVPPNVAVRLSERLTPRKRRRNGPTA